MPALNYAQAYSQALAQAYPYVLHFAALRSAENDSRYRWTGANTIQIPSLTTTGRVDADRDTIGVAKRNFDNAWEPKTLTNHRKWSTLVHPLDIDETNQVASIPARQSWASPMRVIPWRWTIGPTKGLSRMERGMGWPSGRTGAARRTYSFLP